MRIAQTIGEVGLEQGVVAAWSEPRAGQSLKPKFGARPFPRKPLYALLIVVAFFGLSILQSPEALVSLKLVAVALLLIAVAWPVVMLLDRMTKRNVWIYLDQIIITHARNRVVLRKPDLKDAFIYRVGKPSVLALELILTTGKSHVVALPSETEPAELVECLRNIGYQVESDA